MKWLLVLFGASFTIIGLLAVFVPYLRRKSDLVTTWNLFLLGSVNFVGITAMQSGSAPSHLYGVFDDLDYLRFVAGATCFYVTAFITYKWFRWPQRLGAHRMRVWPVNTLPALLSLVALCTVLTAGYLFVPNVQFIGQVMIFVGSCAPIAAVVMLFAAWEQRRFNVPLLAITLVACGAAIAISVARGTGRITLLSSLAAIPFAWYWLRLRYKPVVFTMVPLGVGLALTVVALAGYSAIRHKSQYPGLSPFDVAMQRVRAIPSAFTQTGAGGLIGGDTTESSLLAIDQYTSVHSPQPFFSVGYVLLNPIPRAWWPDKIGSLGEKIARDSGMWGGGGYINLGPGIVGHGYHEGGLLMLVFYGIVLAAGLRFIDEMLLRQPDNPYLLAVLGSVSGYFFALPRGELGLYIIFIISGFITGTILRIVGRMFFGSQVYGIATEPTYDDAGATPSTELSQYEHSAAG